MSMLRPILTVFLACSLMVALPLRALEVNGVLSAVASGDRDGVARYLSSGGDVNLKASEENTLLMIALLHGQLDIASQLLAAGADVHLSNSEGVTPLIRAAARGHARVIRTLLDKGADVKQRDPEGSTALAAAAHRGYIDIVAELIAAGSNVNAVSWMRVQPSADRPHEDRRNLMSPLVLATESGKPELVALLLKHGANVHFQGNNGLTALRKAVLMKNAPIAKLLLEAGANPSETDSNGLTPILSAVNARSPELCSLLLRFGADPNNRAGMNMARTREAWVNPLTQALFRQDHQTIAVLLAGGADVGIHETSEKADVAGDRVSSPLLAAVLTRNPELVSKMLDMGASVSGRHTRSDAPFVSPIFRAARTGSVEILRLLIERGANPFEQDRDGRTLLHEAIRAPGPETFRYLLGIGHSIDARDAKGRTVLIEAVEHSGARAVQLALDMGADVQAQSKSGDTATAVAAAKGKRDVLEILTRVQQTREATK